jgi:hypothetical protein
MAKTKEKKIAPFELGDISNPKKIEAEFSDLDTFIDSLPENKKLIARHHYEMSLSQFNPKGAQVINESLITSAVGKINRDLE